MAFCDTAHSLLKAKTLLSLLWLSLFVHYFRHSGTEHHKSGVENRFFFSIILIKGNCFNALAVIYVTQQK